MLIFPKLTTSLSCQFCCHWTKAYVWRPYRLKTYGAAKPLSLGLSDCADRGSARRTHWFPGIMLEASKWLPYTWTYLEWEVKPPAFLRGMPRFHLTRYTCPQERKLRFLFICVPVSINAAQHIRSFTHRCEHTPSLRLLYQGSKPQTGHRTGHARSLPMAISYRAFPPWFPLQ